MILGLSSCKVAPIIEPLIDEVCDDFEPFYETTDSNSTALQINCPCETKTFDLSTKLVPYSNVQSLIYDCDIERFEQIPMMPSVTRLSSNIMTSNITAFPNLEVFKNNTIMETPLAYELISMPNLKELSLFNVTQFPDVLGTRPLENFKMVYENTPSYMVTVPNNLYQLANLKELVLTNMDIVSFINFENLASLESIKIDKTNIIRFPNLNNQWSKLRTFELSEITMRGGVPNFFGNADSLETIYLSEMELSENLQERIYQTPNLKALTISYCDFNSIPENIGNLTTLESLVITTNQDQVNTSISLPTSIDNLINLKSILVSLNSNQFPSEIMGLTNTLESISIQDNIGHLPAGIRNFDVLKTLKLTNCGLTNLPSEIQNLADTLEKLYLTGNNFDEITKQQIQNWLPNTDIYY